MPEPSFLPWDEPLLPQVARRLTQEFARGNQISLAGQTLVVPGGRGGRRLLELLVEESERAGAFLTPPTRIVTPGSVPELLYQPDLPLASAVVGRRAWARVLGGAPREWIEAVFARSPGGEGAVGRATRARVLAELSAELGGAGKSFRDALRACSEGLAFADTARWSALASLQEAYFNMLAEASLRDRDWARRLALRRGGLGSHDAIFLLGVAEMPGLVRSMLEAIPDRVHPWVHAPPGLRHAFDTLGVLKQGFWLRHSPGLPESILNIRDRPPDQAACVLEILGHLEGRPSPEEVTLGVPDEEVVPFLEQRLAESGLPHRYAEGKPLHRTSPYRLLGATADFLEGSRFEAFAALLRHPEVVGLLGDEAAPAAADRYHADHLPARLEGVGASLPEGGGGIRRSLDVLWSPALLGSLRGTRRLGSWMGDIMRFLASVYGRRLRNPAIPEDHTLIESCNRTREVAEALRDVPPSLDETGTPAEAIRLLLGELRGERLPPEAEEDALELVGWLELHLDDAPILILTGANEPSLPRSVTGDPFLPNALRARLGLEDNEARMARDIYRLSAILASRPSGHVHVLSGRRTTAGDPLRPSRLLMLGGGEEVARRVLRFTVEGTENRSLENASPLAAGLASTSAFALPPEPVIALPAIPQPLPVTDFRRLLADPYLWALERHLELRGARDDAREMDPPLFGSLAHRVLELFGRSPEALETDPRRIAGCLSRLLDDAALERFGPAPLAAVPLQVEQLRSRLMEFARWQAEWTAEGWRIFATEARTPPQGVELDVDGSPILLSGRIDRIDHHCARGTWAILDYKTGDRVRRPEQTHGGPGDWRDLQLPLYRHLLGRLQDTAGAPLEGPKPEDEVLLGYLCLSGEKESRIPWFASWGRAELDDALETARGIIRRLREEGEVRFDPLSAGKGREGAEAALLGRGLLLAVDEDLEEERAT